MVVVHRRSRDRASGGEARPARFASAGDRGSAGIGLAVGATCLVIMMLYGVGALRLTAANGEVSSVSRSAARAAVAAYGPVDGSAAARSVAAETLAARGVVCDRLDVMAHGDWEPGGRVSVTVGCTVALDGLSLAGFDLERTVDHTAVEIVDRFRAGGGR